MDEDSAGDVDRNASRDRNGDVAVDVAGDVAGGFSPPTTSTLPHGRGLSSAPPHPAQRTPGSPLGGHRDTPDPLRPLSHLPLHPSPPTTNPGVSLGGGHHHPPQPRPHGRRPTAVTGLGAARTFAGGGGSARRRRGAGRSHRDTSRRSFNPRLPAPLPEPEGSAASHPPRPPPAPPVRGASPPAALPLLPDDGVTRDVTTSGKTPGSSPRFGNNGIPRDAPRKAAVSPRSRAVALCAQI